MKSQRSHPGKTDGVVGRSGKLLFLYMNARSLMNKLDEFVANVHAFNPDVVGVTESWANDDIDDIELSVDGYTMFRKDRPTNRRGGGVLLYVKSELNAREYQPKTPYPEHKWCRIKDASHRDVYIGICYRTGSDDIFGQDSHHHLRELIAEVSSLSTRTILMGDFNYGGLCWGSDTEIYGTSSAEGRLFRECIDDCFLTQHVLEPTREGVILDLILSGEPDLVDGVQTTNSLKESDHNMLLFNGHLETSISTSTRCRYDYNRADIEGMKSQLGCVNWDDLLGGNTESCWTVFKDLLMTLEKKYVPVSATKKGRKKPIWMTHKAIKLVLKKRKVYAKYKDKNHPAVKKVNREATAEVSRAKLNFETKLASNIKNDHKSFFAYAKRNNRSRAAPGPLVGEDGRDIGTTQEMVEEFNNYFVTVFSAQQKETHHADTETADSVQEAPTLHNIEFSESEIRSKLMRIRDDKASGVDEIMPKLLKSISEEISRPLWIIFRKSIDEGVIPDDWKTANVIPLFKSGSRSRAENYRPISLTSQVCKVLESVIRERLVKHLDKYQLLLESQHGFRKGRSCMTNLLTLVDTVTKNLDEGKDMDIVFLDFAKAFDKVPHGGLIRKLEMHGIGGELRRWIENWLTDRRQRTCVDGCSSAWGEVTSGVPQGSVLGPILFLIFINDLETGVMSWILKFADDTKIYRSISSDEDRKQLQRDLDTLVAWAKEWLMMFNEKKCKSMHLGRGNSQHVYTINGHPMENVNMERDLGVILSRDMKAIGQCNSAYSKANKILGLIKRTIRNKSADIMLRLYKTLVRPHLEYCAPVWSPHFKKDKELLEKVQHRFTRMIPEIKDKPYEERLRILGLWTLEERRNRADLIETFKMIKGMSSVPYENFFDLDSDSRTRGHSLKIVKTRFTGTCRQYSFSQRVISRWNKLDQQTVNSKTLNEFKSRLSMLRQKKMGLFLD